MSSYARTQSNGDSLEPVHSERFENKLSLDLLPIGLLHVCDGDRLHSVVVTSTPGLVGTNY